MHTKYLQNTLLFILTGMVLKLSEHVLQITRMEQLIMMLPETDKSLPAFIKSYEEYNIHKHIDLPPAILRIDTHRHMGGSIPHRFIWQTIDNNGWHHIATDEIDTYCQMVFGPDDPKDFKHFLNKFAILDMIPWTEDLIDQSVKSICDELEADRIDYAWLDFSINKYMSIGWSKVEAISFIHDRFQAHRPNKVGLILSIKYESEKEKQKRYAELIRNDDLKDKLIGIDLVGEETVFDHSFHSALLQEWHNSGKIVRAHVGESGPARNIKTAIEAGVTNIAHGIKICTEPDLIKLAKDLNIYFDLGLTSNILTGVATLENHPLAIMLHENLNVTLGTDDPIICNTTLDAEFSLGKSLRATSHHIAKMKQTAYTASKRLI